MNPKQLREDIIRPTLQYLKLWSKEAEDLVFATACAESLCGEYVKQVGGPALGIYQMEPATLEDINENFLAYKKDLRNKVYTLKILSMPDEENLIYNLAAATALCRIHYLRVSEAIPKDRLDIAKYWKKYYNTPLGKGTVEGFLEKWEKFEK